MADPRTMVLSSALEPAMAAGKSEMRRADLTGCPWHDVKSMLREVGLRPTRQRMALGWILFAKGDRHLTAEMLYEEATKAKVPVSLATVYNTLHQFTDVGLLRQVAVDGSKTYFDTNVSQHHHFFVEGENDLLDIPVTDVVVGKTPVPPEGYEVARIDVVRGGAPGVDMQGRTVIANVVRRQGAGARGAVSFSTQPLYDGRVLNSLRAEGQWRWDGKLVELSMVNGKGPDDALGDGPRVRYSPSGDPIIVSKVDADGQGLREWGTGAFETPMARGRLRLNGA